MRAWAAPVPSSSEVAQGVLLRSPLALLRWLPAGRRGAAGPVSRPGEVVMAGVGLEPVEIEDSTRWRWLLRTEDGEPLASHEVAVPDGDFEYGGFTDLYRWLRWQADPDRRVTAEAELTARVGGWIGEHLLGPEVMEV